MTESTYDWFLEERGITKETLERFRVHIEGSTISFPYANGEKTRKLHPDGKREFYFTEGRKPALYNIGDVGKDVVFIVEGETDTMRLWQEVNEAGKGGTIGVVGLSGVNGWQPQFASSFTGRVFVVLDNDQDYMVQAQVDAAWQRIRSSFGAGKVKRLRLPQDVKDICEFFGRYDLSTLNLLTKRGAGVSRWQPLDLTKPPPPPQWLVEGLVSLGDVTLLAGPSGIGKSWLTMALSIATADNHQQFIGHDVKAHGPVLYIDQENPSDVIYNRMNRLGLKNKQNIRYLWNANIRLDRNPDELLDEVLDYRPKLIVLDSLTRIHTQDENSAGAMATLFNEGIQPLARESGAAVLLIHHNNKMGAPRGSGDIEASVDAVMHVESLEIPGTFRMRQGKSRRMLGGSTFNVQVKDESDGTVRLVYEPPLELPF